MYIVLKYRPSSTRAEWLGSFEDEIDANCVAIRAARDCRDSWVADERNAVIRIFESNEVAVYDARDRV